MDRNIKRGFMNPIISLVALRKESVDRNRRPTKAPQIMPVALRKESVDRNHFPGADLVGDTKSLSARRAWIEIPSADS